jgi:hypothetical protein
MAESQAGSLAHGSQHPNPSRGAGAGLGDAGDGVMVGAGGVGPGGGGPPLPPELLAALPAELAALGLPPGIDPSVLFGPGGLGGAGGAYADGFHLEDGMEH